MNEIRLLALDIDGTILTKENIENFDFQSASGFCIFDIKWASDWVVAIHVQKTEVLVININLTIIAVFGHERDGFPGFNC